MHSNPSDPGSADPRIGPQCVYIAGNAFAAGTVTQRQGRKRENLRSVLAPVRDAALVDYSGMPARDSVGSASGRY